MLLLQVTVIINVFSFPIGIIIIMRFRESSSLLMIMWSRESSSLLIIIRVHDIAYSLKVNLICLKAVKEEKEKEKEWELIGFKLDDIMMIL